MSQCSVSEIVTGSLATRCNSVSSNVSADMCPQRTLALEAPRSTATTGRLIATPSENTQHSGISERIGLDPFQVEEFRDTLVVRTQQFGVYVVRHRRSVDFPKTVRGKEIDLEGQHEYP